MVKKGMKKGERFEEDGFTYEIQEALSDGNYVSKRIDSEEPVETEEPEEDSEQEDSEEESEDSEEPVEKPAEAAKRKYNKK